MTAPSTQQAPPDPRRKVELTIVRRTDLRLLAESGPPPGAVPPIHGGKRDPRYPGTTGVRTLVAILVELVVHLGIAAAAGFAVGARQNAGAGVLVGIAAFLGASILDRVVLQRLCGGSLGKLVTGLRLVRDDDGARPTAWALVKQWFLGAFIAVSMLNW